MSRYPCCGAGSAPQPPAEVACRNLDDPEVRPLQLGISVWRPEEVGWLAHDEVFPPTGALTSPQGERRSWRTLPAGCGIPNRLGSTAQGCDEWRCDGFRGQRWAAIAQQIQLPGAYSGLFASRRHCGVSSGTGSRAGCVQCAYVRARSLSYRVAAVASLYHSGLQQVVCAKERVNVRAGVERAR